MKRVIISVLMSITVICAISTVASAETSRDNVDDHNKDVMNRLIMVMSHKEFDPDAEYKKTSRKPLYRFTFEASLDNYCNVFRLSAELQRKRALESRGGARNIDPLNQIESEMKRRDAEIEYEIAKLAEIGFSSIATEKIFVKLRDEVFAGNMALLKRGRSPSEFSCYTIVEKYKSAYLPKLASHEAQRAEAIRSFARDSNNRLLVSQEWLSQGGLAFMSVMGKITDLRRICIWEDGIDTNVLFRLKDKLPQEMNGKASEYSGYHLRSIHDVLEKLANIDVNHGSKSELEPFDFSDCSVVLGSKAEIVKLKESLEARIGMNMVVFDSDVSEQIYQDEKRIMDAEFQDKRKKWDQEAPARAAAIKATYAEYETMIQWFRGVGTQFDGVSGRSCAFELRMVLEDARRFGGSEYAFGNAQAKSGIAPHCINTYYEYR